MAKKTTMSTAAAKAVAKVMGQDTFKGTWGTGEHLACLRYIATDAAAEAGCTPEQVGKVNAALKAAFAADPELGYASNFQKLLEAAGELKAAGQYE